MRPELPILPLLLLTVGLALAGLSPRRALAQEESDFEPYPTMEELEGMEQRRREAPALLRPEEVEILRWWSDGPEPDDAIPLIALGAILIPIGLITTLIGALGTSCGGFSITGSCSSLEENPDAVIAGSLMIGVGLAVLATGLGLEQLFAAERQARLRRIQERLR